MKSKFVLASSSPRRKELLKFIVDDFDIITMDVDEDIESHCPTDLVCKLAYKKAKATFDHIDDDRVVIGADTVVVFDSKVLGKPKDTDDAFEMLKILSGNTHEVYTGFCIMKDDNVIIDYECTEVVFDKLNDDEINEYIKTKEPMDKAGAYGIQGYGSKLIKKIDGCYFCVMGFPINKIYNELKKANLI